MSASTLSLLDQTELLQLALNASESNDSGTAIAYLKEAVSRPDATAIAHYILGAEYAQSKLYERAAIEMGRAIEIEPGMAIARLQLGLLWLTAAQVDNALYVLGPLQELDDQDPLCLFGQGLTHLVKDEFDQATACLEAGIAANSVNPALNNDMRKILAGINGIDKSAVKSQAEVPSSDEKAEEGDQQHIWLSAYTKGTTH